MKDSFHIIALGKHAVALKKYQTSNNLRQHRGLRNRDVFASGLKEHSEWMEGQKDVRYLDGGGVTDVENERWWEEWWLNWLKASTGVNKKKKGRKKAWLDQTGRFQWAQLQRRRHNKSDWIHTHMVFKGSGYCTFETHAVVLFLVQSLLLGSIWVCIHVLFNLSRLHHLFTLLFLTHRDDNWRRLFLGFCDE